MKNISLTLSDNNQTVQAQANVNLDDSQNDTLKKLVSEIEEDLFTQGAVHLSIEGLLDKPVVLTVTEYGNEV
jgi:benzoyl-CoA reductase/2-hydroxyglutaryl-CoA dehydratase subunit BcrC/BadD/HgdB